MIRTRFAPSPTGFLHIGGLRTALYSYAFAKSQKGKFILRIEDTDRERLVPEAIEKIYSMLKIFDLSWDEGPGIDGPHAPYIQSERTPTGIYKKYAEQLLADNCAYYCFCQQEKEEGKKEESSKENKTKRKAIVRDENCRHLTDKEVKEKLKSGLKPGIRLKVPDNEEVSFYDFVIKKEVSWNSDHVDEAMLLKSDGFPTYHLGVTVDDAVMGVTHILRGHDWLPSTPIHILLFQYLGFSLPNIGHLTDILDPSGGKLSKRKGSVSCEEFLAEGYLPGAILNFIMLLGWAPKDNRELFTLKKFVANIQKGKFQIANPVFNREKLDWFNGVYIRKKTDEELAGLIEEFLKKYHPRHSVLDTESILTQTIPLIKTRITKLADYWPLCQFFFEEVKPDGEMFQSADKIYLQESLNSLKTLKSWTKESIEKNLQDLIAKNDWKVGKFFMAFRIALTGNKMTPPITDSAAILGQKTTLSRLQKALKMIR